MTIHSLIFLFVTLVLHSTSRATAATTALALFFIFNKISYNKSNYCYKSCAYKHSWENIYKGQSDEFKKQHTQNPFLNLKLLFSLFSFGAEKKETHKRQNNRRKYDAHNINVARKE